MRIVRPRLLLLPFVLCTALLQPSAASAATSVTTSTIEAAIKDYVRINTQGYPGQVSFSVGAIDPRSPANGCPAPEVFMPGGARLWGKAHVGVRCPGETGWTIYVPVQVRVVGSYVVTARALPAGYAIQAADLIRRSGDLAQLPGSVIMDPGQATGALLSVGLQGGQPLRGEMLRRPAAVLQGQQVRVTTQGPGFSVSNEGRAVNQAHDGQLVQVRLDNGQTVNGIARVGGTVEVPY